MEQYIPKSALVAEIERRKQTWQHQDQQYVNGGKDVCDYLLGFLDTLEVKEIGVDLGDPKGDVGVKTAWTDLEEAATKYAQDKYLPVQTAQSFKAGAQWQKEQFEKNRLEHCNSITEEQYNLETGFTDYYLDKYHRMPTFLDAIEYGMKKAKEE